MELKILSCLNARCNLSSKEKNYYLSLVKGFEGEKKFDEWLQNLSNDSIILNGLLLEINNTIFQIDTLLIQETLYLLEIKNYEGDFYIEDDKWYTISGNEIKNPLLQVKRSESLLRQLLQDLGFKFPVKSFVIFVNPTFFLYNAPKNLPIIFPTQINRFINKINMNLSNLSNKHLKLKERLLSIQILETTSNHIPNYSYDQLEKGIYCVSCYSFVSTFDNQFIVCNKCGHKENVDSAILRNVEEYKILFPNRRITTKSIYEWCKIVESKKTIRRILAKNLSLIGHGKSSHYVNK